MFSAVAQSCPPLCNPMDCSTQGFPVHHQLPELAQTHVHWVRDAIQPSYHLLSLSPPVFDLSQHQGLFQWVSSLHQVAKVLELQLQHLSVQWIFRTDNTSKVKMQSHLKYIYREKARDAFDLHCSSLISNLKKKGYTIVHVWFFMYSVSHCRKMGLINGGGQLDEQCQGKGCIIHLQDCSQRTHMHKKPGA